MFKWVGGLIDRVFAVTGAFAFSQLPLFMQQYQQQLLGHVSELQLQLDAMKNAAALSGKSLEQYVIKFINSGDLDFVHQGELMNNMIHRYDTLLKGYNSLHEAPVYGKPFYFIHYFDADIARATWSTFEFGFAFSVDSLVYATFGILTGILLYITLTKIPGLRALARGKG